MKALVTGGAGFIGSHIAEGLCRQGAEVVVLDNLSLGDAKNLAWKKSSDRLDLVSGTICDTALVKKLVSGCDAVFHLAAIPSVPLSVEKPLETNEENLNATLGLLAAARDAGVKRFVFASSSAIYGDSDKDSKREDDPVKPQSPYALQKYAGERYAQMFHTLYGLETVSLRYFNIFGPRQSFNSPYSGVIAKFCVSVLEGKQPTIFGDGLQSRDFTPVANVVRANLLAVERPAEQVAGGVFNVGLGASVTLLQLLADLNKLTGQDLQPIFQPERKADVRSSKANIDAAKQRLGYTVVAPWERGLEETLDFYRHGA
jgi:UDP-glucose 4-epimerase